MDIDVYLERIGFEDEIRIDYRTLCALQRAHILSIPFENIDIHLGRPLSMEPAKVFDKVVLGQRGGWCYELNFLFAALLKELGFNVEMVGMLSMQLMKISREQVGKELQIRHPGIAVNLDSRYIADVGSGDGPLQPIKFPDVDPKIIGRVPPNDFTLAADWFLESPLSPHLKSVICVSVDESTVTSLFDRQLQEGKISRVIESAEDFVNTLNKKIGIDLPEAAGLWPDIVARDKSAKARVPA
ncbi:hypothetical protein BTJ40_04995 [Microbulbifer sp. A4B17]|uniref:arylamine N-acetyltransferase family protein n=1 Tax=Microbulbifer sp. A4B17 TaxID=359370 RepID=UPI000D52CC7A|nr:arylamine N-acetyltransferase [Microbulbifer sp. A4B17]AWF80217.1 hypothetical protein BTJ40_04995 [Microbulbifer sp. A4B17]